MTDLGIARIHRTPLPGSAAALADIVPAGQAARIDSRSLFRDGDREVVITHDGADYRLRLTASGKLILTK